MKYELLPFMQTFYQQSNQPTIMLIAEIWNYIIFIDCNVYLIHGRENIKL